MTDMKKVLRGLEKCIADDFCDDCPYERKCDEDDHDLGTALMADALELLKEQQETIELQGSLLTLAHAAMNQKRKKDKD